MGWRAWLGACLCMRERGIIKGEGGRGRGEVFKEALLAAPALQVAAAPAEAEEEEAEKRDEL